MRHRPCLLVRRPVQRWAGLPFGPSWTVAHPRRDRRTPTGPRRAAIASPSLPTEAADALDIPSPAAPPHPPLRESHAHRRGRRLEGSPRGRGRGDPARGRDRDAAGAARGPDGDPERWPTGRRRYQKRSSAEKARAVGIARARGRVRGRAPDGHPEGDDPVLARPPGVRAVSHRARESSIVEDVRVAFLTALERTVAAPPLRRGRPPRARGRHATGSATATPCSPARRPPARSTAT